MSPKNKRPSAVLVSKPSQTAANESHAVAVMSLFGDNGFFSSVSSGKFPEWFR